MGIMPSEFKRMTVWELNAVTERWVEAHTPSDGPGSRLTPDERDEIWDWMQTKNIPLSHRKSNGAGTG